MIKHFSIQPNEESLNTFLDSHQPEEIGYPRIDLIEESGESKLKYKTAPPPHDYSKDYLTVEALEDGTLGFYASEYFPSGNITSVSYSVSNGATWITENDLSQGLDISLQVTAGDKILWKGIAKQYGNQNDDQACGFYSNKKVNISGNIMSMIWGDEFTTNSEFKNESTDVFFQFLGTEFRVSSLDVVDASNLILPANNLKEKCYYGLFAYCFNLINPPKILPAINLAERCYRDMFRNCRSMTSIPNLPATILAESCYNDMFWGCTSLTTALSLPATTLANACYNSMFGGCTSLTQAPELPATTLSEWCYSSMFAGCTSLTKSPDLLANTLVNNCYAGMFSDCSSLNSIKMLATDISATNCLASWVDGVAASGTFIKDANTTIPTGTSGIPSGWTVQTA